MDQTTDTGARILLVDDEAAAVLLAMRGLHASESCSAFSGGGSLSIGPGGTPTARAMSER